MEYSTVLFCLIVAVHALSFGLRCHFPRLPRSLGMDGIMIQLVPLALACNAMSLDSLSAWTWNTVLSAAGGGFAQGRVQRKSQERKSEDHGQYFLRERMPDHQPILLALRSAPAPPVFLESSHLVGSEVGLPGRCPC